MPNGLRSLSNLGGVQDVGELTGQRPSLTGGAGFGGVSLSQGGQVERFIPQAPEQAPQPLTGFADTEGASQFGISPGETEFEWAIAEDQRQRAEHSGLARRKQEILSYGVKNRISSEGLNLILKQEGLDKAGGEYKPDKLVESLIPKGRQVDVGAVSPDKYTLGSIEEYRRTGDFNQLERRTEATAPEREDFNQAYKQALTLIAPHVPGGINTEVFLDVAGNVDMTRVFSALPSDAQQILRKTLLGIDSRSGDIGARGPFTIANTAYEDAIQGARGEIEGRGFTPVDPLLRDFQPAGQPDVRTIATDVAPTPGAFEAQADPFTDRYDGLIAEGKSEEEAFTILQQEGL